MMMLNMIVYHFTISENYFLFQDENMVFSGGVDSKIVQFRQIINKVNTSLYLWLGISYLHGSHW